MSIFNTIKEIFSSNIEKPEVVQLEQIPNQKKGRSVTNPLMELSEIELRDLCRHHIDTFENWSRRLIDETLKKNYGEDYFNHMISEQQPLIKSEIKKRIEQRVIDNPHRFPRKIDAILMEDIEYFFCRDDLYNGHFKAVLEPFYSGKNEIRVVLERLIPIRNKLSHGNTISIHEAEQCLCYVNDFIEVYKQHYISLGKNKVYNVPVFLRIKDSLGNDIIRKDSSYSWEMYSLPQTHKSIQLRSGDDYKLWVEVDSSFDSSFYEIKWVITQMITDVIAKGSGTEIRFQPTNKNVSYSPTIKITLRTKRDWHRFGKVDDIIELHLDDILPPIEDSF